MALTFPGESASLGQLAGRLTLVAGSAFCISARNGAMYAGSPHGLFFQDTRFLSRFELTIDGVAPEALGVVPDRHFAATLVARTRPSGGRSGSLLVLRRRTLSDGLREEVVVRNHERSAHRCILAIDVAADFADIFEVKESRVERDRCRTIDVEDDRIVLRDEDIHATEVHFTRRGRLDGSRAEFEVALEPKGEWALTVDISARAGTEEASPADDGVTGPREDFEERIALWEASIPSLHTRHDSWQKAFSHATRDVGSLRIFDPRYGNHPVLAAGAPWFMTLFGRDSMLGAWMSLLVDPTLLVSTLEVLAQLQGNRVNRTTEEEPGRILHEVRFGHSSLLGPSGQSIYYGSIDATPLFVMLVAEAARWGADAEVISALLPHVDRALVWIDEFGDRDGDGYVEYERTSDEGLTNQGWKDSWDAISYADGTLATAPIALCEVQAYVYGAFCARAELAERNGDAAAHRQWLDRAQDLKARFDRDFWLDDRGWYALALDRDKRPVDSLASNMGHCLWTGIASPERVDDVAAHLLSPELFSGWGVRTLARSMARYDPLSYHNGSVWPHDTVISATGLMHAGKHDEAGLLIRALLDTASEYGGHLPELFTGLDRNETGAPVDYPTSSSPQAWAAASPLQALRTLLGLRPDVPAGAVSVASRSRAPDLRLSGVRLGPHRTTIDVHDGQVIMSDLPPGVRQFTD